jgi:hypothetical protein
MVQGSGEKHGGKSEEQSACGETQEHASGGSGELRARARGNRQVLRAIGRSRVNGRVPFGRKRDGNRPEHKES